MMINTHAHVHNLKSILTKECLRIMLLRVENHKFAEIVQDGLTYLLDHISEASDTDAIAKLFGQRVAEGKLIRKALKAAGVEDTRVGAIVAALKESILDSGDFKSIRAALQILDAVLGANPEKDWQSETLGDFLDFLRLALLPSIDRVTDELLEQMGREDAVVPLMMDIVGKAPLKRDLKLFQAQLDDTARQIWRYPGRVLPFVKANPHRNNHAGFDSCLTVVQKALQEKGFVGVKLYPSLGYDVREVEDVLQYCASDDVQAPVLFHCNRGGFKAGPDEHWRGEPKLWGPFLQAMPKLRVCFAHFGGDTDVAACDPQNPSPDGANWAEQILHLMTKYPGQVYTDISYNTLPMDGTPAAADYLQRLKKILNTPAYDPYVLYGTDYFLVRQRLRDRHYEEFFRKHLSAAHFRQIARDNPLVFLGVTPDISPTMRRHLDFIATPFKADWSMAGGLLLGHAALYDELANKMKTAPPMWNPARIPCQKAVTEYLYGQLGEEWQKEVDKEADWALRLGDYQVMHLASYGGNTSWRDGIAEEMVKRLKKAKCQPASGSSGWQDVYETTLEWSARPGNSIAGLGSKFCTLFG